MTMQAKLGNSLLKSLIQMRDQKGQLSLEDVGAMFEEMATSLHIPESPLDMFLRKEISRLANYIETTKKEIKSMAPEDESGGIGDASLHLDAVLKHTEEASNSIMDAADTIQGAIAGIGGETEQKIMDATMQIYEACNFQDLTGQRINKVITLLNQVDECISKLHDLFGAEEAAAVKAEKNNVINADFNEKSLLNGPQLPSGTPTQADIDALFNSM